MSSIRRRHTPRTPGSAAGETSDRVTHKTRARAERWLLVLGAVLLALGVALLYRANVVGSAAGTPSAPTRAYRLPPPSPHTSTSSRSHAATRSHHATRSPAAGVPTWLVVPKLGISTSVVPVRKNPAGVLWPPDDPSLTGWWAQGARPGAARGSAVIVGHTVHAGGGVFDRLPDLRPGDAVRVTTRHGVIRYSIVSTVVVRKTEFARRAENLLSQSTPGKLVLVSCTNWNGTEFVSNVVVSARPR